MAKTMVQTTKCFLIYQPQDTMDYGQFCKATREIQYGIRKLKNRASSESFDFLMKKVAHFDEHGVYPKEEELIGEKFRNRLYHIGTELVPECQTGNISAALQEVDRNFKKRSKAILSGDASIPSYGKNQPIDIHKKSIQLSEVDGKYLVALSLFSRGGVERYGLKNGQCIFEVFHKCKSSIEIVKRCISGEYSVSGSKLMYNEKERMWELALAYQFDKEEIALDPDRILGVDLGIAIPMVVAISDSEKRWYFRGKEIEELRRRIEGRRRDMSRERPCAGGGSVGHGRNTRMKPVDQIADKIKRFRDTKNDAWSRELVNIAVKNGCGTIQMEDLSGISAGAAPKFLKDWTYYDLQQKITYKAQAKGMQVIKVDPRYTSQRCSCCGAINKENRETQESFVCKSCGYTANADYNAAKNLSICGIDKIIAKQCEPKALIKSA